MRERERERERERDCSHLSKIQQLRDGRPRENRMEAEKMKETTKSELARTRLVINSKNHNKLTN